MRGRVAGIRTDDKAVGDFGPLDENPTIICCLRIYGDFGASISLFSSAVASWLRSTL